MSISILLVFEISVPLVLCGSQRNDRGSRSFRWSTARKTGNNETPLLILRPIMSQRRVVSLQPGCALGDFVSHPFQAHAIDAVVVWIVLVLLRLLGDSAFFSPPHPVVSMVSQSVG